jgi:3-phosphoglycerate kinase
LKELSGAGFFWIDGQGPFLVAGSMAASSFDALMKPDVVAGSNAIAAGMRSLGIPRDSIDRYEEAVLNGAFLLIFCGPRGVVEEARRALHRSGAAGLTCQASDEARPPDD